MIRTGEEYRESIRDERAVYIKGKPVNGVPGHPMFKSRLDRYYTINDQVTWKAGTSVTGQSSFPGTTAAAVKKASA